MVKRLQHGLHIPVLDDDPSVDEVNAALKHIGTGISLDGISPRYSENPITINDKPDSIFYEIMF